MKELLKIRDFMKEMRRPSASSPSSLILFMMALAMMMLVPSTMRGATETYNFNQVATAAYEHAANPSDATTYCNYSTSGDYSGISGGKIISSFTFRSWLNTTETVLDINDRLAYRIANAASNAHSDTDGLYLRGEKNGNNFTRRGLYCGKWYQELAILNLKPGDKVTFYFEGADNPGVRYKRISQNVHCSQDNSGDIYNYTNDKWFTNSNNSEEHPINITSAGDLRVELNQYTYITSIKIESADPATYTIVPDGAKTTFEFTGAGVLEDNDFYIPSMAASFGSLDDFLVVGNDNQCRMIKGDGSETLETNGPSNQPSAGSFYAFKPTSSGKLIIEGGLQGNCVHLFVYDNENNRWSDRAGDGNIYYSKTYNNDDDHYITIEIDIKNTDLHKTFYICINNLDTSEHTNAFHLHKFSFTPSLYIEKLAKVVENVDKIGDNDLIHLTKITIPGGSEIKLEKCSKNIDPSSVRTYYQSENLYMYKPTFVAGSDHAGTVILNVHTDGGDARVVVTFPYHAYYNPAGYTDTNRTYGHTWNFMDTRLSDSNSENSWVRNSLSGFATGEAPTGLLSIGRYTDTESTFRIEAENREWILDHRLTGSSGGTHDPYYKNVYDMVGDNADMIWETEGLWFDTGTNLSCIYNEKDAARYYKKVNGQNEYVDPTQPMDFTYLDEDPDRYVGLLPDPDGKSSFTIPCLKDGDRVLIFMKSGEATGTNGIFLNVHGALDAEGTPINKTDLYKAGGTNWIHSRYEGCYHFIKKGDGNMKFDMVGGSMCKLLYIRIYQGKRIDTNDIVSTKYIPTGEVDANGKQKYTTDAGHLLFINDKGATEGDYSTLSEHYSGKGQNAEFQVLTYSGNLNTASFEGDNFKISGAYNNLLDFKSKVGEMGVFRLRVKDLTYTYTNNANQNKNYVADLCDRNFTVGYRDKVTYPYTWDFTDVKTHSGGKIKNEADNYTETSDDYENTGWDISLFDKNGYMKVNSGVDPSAENQIFSADKAGFGNQLWADDGVIAETQGLWFYTDNNDPLYNDCLQLTSEGMHFVNTVDNPKHDPWWNYKMVVPSVPANAAVYLRMKRDSRVQDSDHRYSQKDQNDVLFLNTRFNFGTDDKTSLTNAGSNTYALLQNGTDYSFYEVGKDEYVVAIKNTTGSENNLVFTLNGWTLKKLGVSLDPKKIGKTGYTTESHGRRIDHSLTSQFTGETIKAYTAHFAKKEGSSDLDYSTAVLTRFDDTDHPNMSESTAKQNRGCILYHDGGTTTGDVTDRTAAVLDGCIHLFVPDMWDNKNDSGRDVSVGDNILLAFQPVVGSFTYDDKTDDDNYVDDIDGTNSNLVLSAKKYRYGTSSNVAEGYDVSFVRVDPDGNGGKGAFLNKCSAYIQIPTSEMTVLKKSNNSKVNIVFEEDFYYNEGVATGVTTFSSDNATCSEVYYTLSGVPVNKPTKGGMYIKNGKKVLVK